MEMTSEEQPLHCSAVILAGGLNTRMGGRNKAFLKLDGETLLNRILTTLESIFKEIILVARDARDYGEQPCRVVEDIIDVRSSLTGVHAGLSNTTNEYIFAVPCDAPFLMPALVRLMLNEIDGQSDVIVPVYDQHYEPLCAVYGRRCLPKVEALLGRGDLTIYHLYDHIRLKTIPAEQIRQADPLMASFFNVNTPEAYKAAQKHLQCGAPLKKT
jgi:molybdopterin-guanine dinucleotide biosynthesis protein A